MKVFFDDGTMKTTDLRDCIGYICHRIELEPVDLVQIARMQQECPEQLSKILVQLAARPAENRVCYEKRVARESVPAGEFYDHLIGENRQLKSDRRKSNSTIRKLRAKKKNLEERTRSQGKQLETWHKGEGVSDLVHEVRELKERLGERDDKIIHLTQERDKLNDVAHDQNVKFADLLNQLDEAGGLAKDAEEDRVALCKDRDLWENRARNLRQWVAQTMRDKFREWK